MNDSRTRTTEEEAELYFSVVCLPSSAFCYAITPMMSDSFMIRSSSPSSLTSVPDHLPNSTRSPALTPIGVSLPLSSRPPGPTATTSPSCGFSFAVSGMMMPPLVFSSASIRLTTTRSWSGRNFSFAMITLGKPPCAARPLSREMPSFRLFQWVSTHRERVPGARRGHKAWLPVCQDHASAWLTKWKGGRRKTCRAGALVRFFGGSHLHGPIGRQKRLETGLQTHQLGHGHSGRGLGPDDPPSIEERFM